MKTNLADRLSKSRYMEGLRCPLAVYLSVHNYELRGTPTPEQQSRFDVGNRVGEIARDRYPGGVLIEQGHMQHREAMTATQAALEAGELAIFEAAFCHDNVKVRVDVLRRLEDGGFELIEVKSGSKYSADKHLPDAGVQLHVVLGSGIDVRRVSLMHLNKSYVYPGGEYDPQQILTATDITREAFDYLACVPEQLDQMMATIALPEPPTVTPGALCSSPYDCAFIDWCNRAQSTPSYDGEVSTVPAILARLDDLRYPLHFVDFETLMPALPIFVGSSPYGISRVQWSIHTLHADGRLEHTDWLVDDGSRDPDPQFMRTLLESLGAEGSFIHYSPYERTQLVGIAVRYPEFRQPLVERIPGFRATLASKLETDGASSRDVPRAGSDGLLDFDLGMRVISRGCNHPSLESGSYTLKTVSKLLARDLPPYEGLAVSNGDQAMLATQMMLSPATPTEQIAQIRADLREYCAQDTLVMVAAYKKLMEIKAAYAER